MTGAASLSLAEAALALEDVLARLPDPAAAALCRLAAVRLRNPAAFVTVAGETSTGKSTLINSLLGSALLPAFARPTTASVTHVVCMEQQPPRFLAVYRDATQEELTRDRFAALSAAPSEDILRLQLRATPASSRFLGLQVFDTPGYNAVVTAHEEVLRRFLPESDVIVFVTGYRTGFGQNDQDLLELIRQCTEDDPTIPVLLVVNRAPGEAARDDKRISEILTNGADSLHRTPELCIVRTASAGADSVSSSADAPPSPVLPDTSSVWEAVRRHIESPARGDLVVRKLRGMLQQQCQLGRETVARRRALLMASGEDLRAIRSRVEALAQAREQSRAAVMRSAERLASIVPPAIDHLADAIRQKLVADIDRSGKWLGKDDCVHWIVSHALPFEVRAAGKQVEDTIRVELERLDRELQDIANTAVGQLERVVDLKSDASAEFVASVARTLAMRLGGGAFSSVARAFGGVGGAAAGAGNLVKMLVSRAGAVFGKTFSREVYNQIGRTFTKRALQRLNVAVSILIDVGVFVYDAHTWQKKVAAQVADAVAKWREDVRADVLQNQVPAIRAANLQGVDDVYSGLISELRSSLEEKSRNVVTNASVLGELDAALQAARSQLDSVSVPPAG